MLTGLDQEELEQLASLLERVDNTQIKGRVWSALVKKFPTVPIELIVLDGSNRVLMSYRDDAEFKGWHVPGSVWNDWETIPERRAKLVEHEITELGIRITKPKSIGWIGVYRGTGPYQVTSRNACVLMHIAYLEGKFIPREGINFFRLDALPMYTLPHHEYMLGRVQKYLKDGIPLSD